MSTQKTFGEKLVGIDFNPSGDENVRRVKELSAELADILYLHMKKTPSTIGGGVREILYEDSICELLKAQMCIVKVLTFK